MKILPSGFLLLSPLLCLGVLPPLHSAEVSYVFNARLLGGQYFFENQESDLAGNAGILFAPAVQVNDRWSVIPTLSAAWRGTKNVQDLVGGGTIFQQTQDHSASVKAIYKAAENWLIKSGGAYRIQLLKETKDEKWGKGLFDFQKPSLNLEVERAFSKETSLRAGYDLFWIDFRNYSSLESQQRDLGRENVGSKTLNTQNHAPYLAWRSEFAFFERAAKYDFSYYYAFRNFTEQKVVLPTGDLSGDLRRDKSQIASINLTLPYFVSETFKILDDFRVGAAVLTSNQNNYDASKTRFNDNYYAYKEFSLGTNKNFLLGAKPWVLSAGFSYARRNYDSRPTQNDSGDYGTEKIHLNEYYLNLGATYPVNKNFRVQALGNFGWSRSNMKYEQTYRYNYETFAYLLGVVYDY